MHHLTGHGMMLEAWSLSLWAPLCLLLQSGYLAVGIFFELSGFVLAKAYESPEWCGESLLKYGVCRFARVYPVYVLSLAVMLPFILESNVAGKAGVVASHGLVLQGWTGPLPVSWNTPAWSLSCEIFFYLCFPFCAIALKRLNWTSALALAALTCFLPGILRLAGVPHTWKPLLQLADFVMGIVAARVLDLLLASRVRLIDRGYWLYVPSAITAVILTAFPGILAHLVTLNSVLRPLNALLLLGLSLGGGVAVAGLSSGISVYLGKVSYSMYILHIPLLWWFRRLIPGLIGTLPGPPMALLYLTGVVGISAIVFRYVEEPANRFLRARLLARAVN